MRTLLALLLTATAAAQDMPLRDWTVDGEGWTKAEGKKPERNEVPFLDPQIDGKAVTVTALVLTPKEKTIYFGFKGQRYVWAMSPGVKTGPPQPYCSLRCPIGKDTTTDVSSLTVDAVGRIYAATPLGVQVFDPTGRLSGVLLPPATGEMSHLGWEKDELVVWVGEQKYARKMNVK